MELVSWSAAGPAIGAAFPSLAGRGRRGLHDRACGWRGARLASSILGTGAALFVLSAIVASSRPAARPCAGASPAIPHWRAAPAVRHALAAESHLAGFGPHRSA